MRIALTISLLLFFGCKKPTERNCLKGTGSEMSTNMGISSKSNIMLYDDIDINLIQDSLDYIEIKSYDNIIPFITIDTIGDTIKIANSNRCNYVRNRDKKTTVNFHFTELKNIFLYGSGTVNSSTIINLTALKIQGEHGSSQINLDVNCDVFTSNLLEGNMNLTVTGNVKNAYFFQSKYSIIDASDLVTEKAKCSNKSTGDIICNTMDTLQVELLGVGNIFYKGNPTIIYLKDVGLGKVEAFN